MIERECSTSGETVAGFSTGVKSEEGGSAASWYGSSCIVTYLPR